MDKRMEILIRENEQLRVALRLRSKAIEEWRKSDKRKENLLKKIAYEVSTMDKRLKKLEDAGAKNGETM